MRELDILNQRIAELESALDMWINKLEIGYNHFAVLYSLVAAQDEQCTQKKISEEWYLPKQTVFNICKEYKEKGWIEFSESQTDKRERVMRLSNAGKSYAEPIYQATEQLSDKVFARFGKKKTAQLFSLLSEFSECYRRASRRSKETI